MQSEQQMNLRDRDKAVACYEERYVRGYMTGWPEEKKQKIAEIVRGISLPESGDGLDFGCGNGVLTEVVRQALPPGWRMHGVEISQTAVENARRAYPNCRFFNADSDEIRGKQFDFLFSHHVLEHVYDLPAIVEQVSSFLKDDGVMLHVLPCGNEGSFEHGVCLLRRDGINSDSEGRFFFEEEGHLRRLTTERAREAFSAKGFKLWKEFYSNQHWGSVLWLSLGDAGLIRSFADPSRAVNSEAATRLSKVRRRLLAWWMFRIPTFIVERRLGKEKWTLRDYVMVALGLPFYPASKAFDSFLHRSARTEWETRKADRQGSEMFLLFQRKG